MALEDFTTYTKVGANADKIAVNSPTEIYSTLQDGDYAYMYKDFGAGFFSDDQDVEIQFEFELTNIATRYSYMVGISDQLGSFQEQEALNMFAVYHAQYGSRSFFRNYENGSLVGDENTSNGIYAAGTPFYGTIIHAGGTKTWTYNAYSDSLRQTLIGSAVITSILNLTTMRYLMPTFTGFDPKPFYIRNLEIVNPPVGPEPEPAKGNPLLFGQDF